jgi:hypothetical protein
MDTEERRRIAALATVPGYQKVLDLVLKPAIKDAESRLTSTTDQDKLYRAAIEFQWAKLMYNELSNLPLRLAEELKDEGDQIYGA